MADAGLGTCCACEGTAFVRNIVMLPWRSPTPGHGWACLVCGLPNDGAVAVVCDTCMDRNTRFPVACRGYPASEGRIPMSELTEKFEHDKDQHAHESQMIVRRGEVEAA